MNIKDLFFNTDENIYNNLPDAIIILDFMRNIIVWNTKAEMLFGYTKAEVKNKNVKMLFQDDFERFNKIIGLNHGTILNAITKSGESIFVDVTAFDAYNSAKTIISVRALSNKFLELQNLLDEYQATKMLVSNRDSFISNLKFDFINPLNASIGFSQSLLDGICGKTTKKQEKYLSIINTNTKKTKALLDKIFEIIALDADNREFLFKNFEFGKIIEHVITNQKNKLEDKNLKFTSTIETEKRNIYSDEYAFAQVLEILLDNAIKFTDLGEVKLLISHPDRELLEAHEIKIPAGYDEKSFFKIELSDTGIGIADDRLREIFDEYNSKNLAISQKYEGTALSLPIARKIVHKLNGRIWCEHNEQNGSKFIILMPIEKMVFD